MANRSVTKDVVLNVYNLHDSNRVLGTVGLGFYHSGVEIGGKEYSFGPGGISRTNPKLPEFGDFRESIVIGTVDSMEFVNSTLALLGASDFTPGEGTSYFLHAPRPSIEFNNLFHKSTPPMQTGPGTYDIVNKNCNTFSNAVCMSLCGKPIPSWVNRAAAIGSTLSIMSPTDTSQERAIDKRYSLSGNFYYVLLFHHFF